MKLTDTHCHLDLEQFDADRDAVLQRAINAGVTRILIPSLTGKSSRAAVKLAESNPMLYAAVGVHPNEAEIMGRTNHFLVEENSRRRVSKWLPSVRSAWIIIGTNRRAKNKSQS